MKLIAHSYGFQGGRFRKHRYVRTLAIYASSLPSWCHDRLEAAQQNEIEQAILRAHGVHSVVSKWRGCSANEFVFDDGDKLTLPLFGITSEQYFHRLMRGRWTIKTKSALWWVPLAAVEQHFWSAKQRGRGSAFDKIPKQDEPLFARYTGDFIGYDGIDCGAERKPPVWVCNLCGRSAVWQQWPKAFTAGLASSEYIASCPNCQAQRGDLFKQVETEMQAIGALEKPPTPAFRPEKRSQDNLWFDPP